MYVVVIALEALIAAVFFVLGLACADKMFRNVGIGYGFIAAGHHLSHAILHDAFGLAVSLLSYAIGGVLLLIGALNGDRLYEETPHVFALISFLSVISAVFSAEIPRASALMPLMFALSAGHAAAAALLFRKKSSLPMLFGFAFLSRAAILLTRANHFGFGAYNASAFALIEVMTLIGLLLSGLAYQRSREYQKICTHVGEKEQADAQA